jgi:hypothetical protein
MASMEGLSNIRRGKFDYHLLASLGRIVYVFQTKEGVLPKDSFLLKNRGNEDFCELVDLEEELKECAITRGWVD